jgi:hypothetical protein
MMEKAQDMQNKAKDCSDPKYASKMLQLAQKLTSAAGSF